MKSTKSTALLLYGGKGCEADVSEKGAIYLRSLIPSDSYNLIPVFIDKRGGWFIKEPGNTAPPSPESAVTPAIKGGLGGISTSDGFLWADCAFPLLHGDFGEDGVIQGALAAANIPYVGADNYLGPLAMDKAYTKIIAESLGVKCAKSVLAIRGSDLYGMDRAKRIAEETFGYPMFIKPARLGSSVGASAVLREEDFLRAYSAADAVCDGRVLIEELVDIATEAECAVFRVKNKEIITDFGSISCNFGFYDYEKKYSGESGASVSDFSDIDPRTKGIMREYSSRLTDVLGIRHLARIDFFITKKGEVLFNEINTMPGFTCGSLYPKLLERAGIDPSWAVSQMIEDARGS